MNSDLYYVDNISGKALPNWGEFFIRLGCKIVQLNENNKRTIIAIAVPTRAFSAALISFGVVVSLASNNKQITKGIYHGDQQFKYFSHLKSGTSLLIRSENKLISGIFTGCTVDKNDGIVKVGVFCK